MCVCCGLYGVILYGYAPIECDGCTPLLRRTFLQNLTPAYNPHFPLSITLMPKKPNPDSQKVVL